MTLSDRPKMLACPRALRHAKSVLVPIHARDAWMFAAGEDIAPYEVPALTFTCWNVLQPELLVAKWRPE